MMHPLKRFLNYLERLVSLPGDQEEERTRKATLCLISILIGMAGIIWSVMYLALGHVFSAIFPFLYSFIVGTMFVLFLKNKRFETFLNTQLF